MSKKNNRNTKKTHVRKASELEEQSKKKRQMKQATRLMNLATTKGLTHAVKESNFLKIKTPAANRAKVKGALRSNLPKRQKQQALLDAKTVDASNVEQSSKPAVRQQEGVVLSTGMDIFASLNKAMSHMPDGPGDRLLKLADSMKKAEEASSDEDDMDVDAGGAKKPAAGSSLGILYKRGTKKAFASAVVKKSMDKKKRAEKVLADFKKMNVSDGEEYEGEYDAEKMGLKKEIAKHTQDDGIKRHEVWRSTKQRKRHEKWERKGLKAVSRTKTERAVLKKTSPKLEERTKKKAIRAKAKAARKEAKAAGGVVVASAAAAGGA